MICDWLAFDSIVPISFVGLMTIMRDDLTAYESVLAINLWPPIYQTKRNLWQINLQQNLINVGIYAAVGGVFPLQLRNVEESVINYTRSAAKYAVKPRKQEYCRIAYTPCDPVA